MKILTNHNPPMRVSWSVVASPAGKLVVGVTEKNEICRIAFLPTGSAAKVVVQWRKKWPKTEFYKGPTLKELPKKPILLIGTDFQCAVWRVLAKISRGRTITYKEIARRMGKTSAARAVGGACGANPVPYLIPCHRVVAAHGLGGFSGGLKIKKNLLKAEKTLIY